ncbi:MAG TPA: tyrosine-type recombinase/integrase, partial [Nitrospira sp.]|nr:tyrosine-type recombinase/integrase [Nitrospira sp.]
MRLLQAVEVSHEPALAVVVWLAIATGARKEELLGLRWRDVDWARQQLVFHHTKNHERRTVPVRGEAWTRLEAWARGVARIGPDWVFPRKDGKKTAGQPLRLGAGAGQSGAGGFSVSRPAPLHGELSGDER